MHMHAKRSHPHVKDPISMSDVGGLLKHQNNLPYVKVFEMLKLDTVRKEKEELVCTVFVDYVDKAANATVGK